MSGTRSRFPKAPATEAPMRDALIVAHGQPSDPAPPEAAMARLARQVQRCLPGWRVSSATLAAPERLEATLARLSENVLVYPFFMSDGWFVRKALPDRLACVGPVTLVPPFGLEPQLPELAAGMIRRAMASHGLQVESSCILLSAHGTVRSLNAARAAQGFADRLEYLLPGVTVKIGFIEQDPFIRDVAAQLGGPVFSLPFFALNGDHYQQDILPVLDQSGLSGLRLPVLGAHPFVPGLIARALDNAASQRTAA